MLILNTDLYKLFRPLLFTLPPETAQAAAEFALKRAWVWRALSPALETRDPRLQVDLCGLKLGNPVGLAAGYDKNCEFLPSMAALGFGYVTGGTVTESARPGNPRPRVLRYAERQSLINSLGFPSRGLEFAARRLERTHPSANAPVIVSVSGVTEDEIVGCHRRLEPMADAIEINISSPNTAGLRVFQQPPALAELLGKVNDERQKPLFVKLPPYSSSTTGPAVNEGRDQVLALARVSKEQGAEGLTVANSRPSEDSRLAVASGGLSGKAISLTCFEWWPTSRPRSATLLPSTPAAASSQAGTHGRRCGPAQRRCSF